MALEGCNACLKYLMIIWNFLILLLGLAILGIGVWVVVDKDSGKFVDDMVDSNLIINYSRVSDSNLFELTGYLLIGLGVVVVVIALLGLCGALRESQCLLGTCFVVLFLIFGALLGVGIWVYIEKDNMDVDNEKLYYYLKEVLDEAVENYGKDEESKKFMDAVQKKFDCCGSERGFPDYGAISPGLAACITNLNQPCLPRYKQYVEERIGLKQFFSGRMTVTVAVALGLAGALVLAMVFTLILCCAVRRSGSY
ncbi:CD9 antigen-like [Pomacea canaliculata]|uniref:CD9 antigen-like n=1 Tax=Pomacea canaliculata TaxID=400727 RepID=UPI000D72B754|nr:CD9 antigen-like [Pomacea canaliculata]